MELELSSWIHLILPDGLGLLGQPQGVKQTWGATHHLRVTLVPRKDLSPPNEAMQMLSGSFAYLPHSLSSHLPARLCAPGAAGDALQYTQGLAEPLSFLFIGSVSESGRLVMYLYLLVGDL